MARQPLRPGIHSVGGVILQDNYYAQTAEGTQIAALRETADLAMSLVPCPYLLWTKPFDTALGYRLKGLRGSGFLLGGSGAKQSPRILSEINLRILGDLHVRQTRDNSLMAGTHRCIGLDMGQHQCGS
jgi:hypothetical protein